MEHNGRGRRKGSGARAGIDAPLGLRVVQALADPSRWRAVELLRPEGQTVSELARALGLSLPCTSHHVSILKEVGVLTMLREGKSMRCRLAAAGTPVGDLVRTARAMAATTLYVSNITAELPSVAAYTPSGGAVPEFEPSRR
jgi:DNA-binding transcriptional ArsR family regulator